MTTTTAKSRTIGSSPFFAARSRISAVLAIGFLAKTAALCPISSISSVCPLSSSPRRSTRTTITITTTTRRKLSIDSVMRRKRQCATTERRMSSREGEEEMYYSPNVELAPSDSRYRYDLYDDTPAERGTSDSGSAVSSFSLRLEEESATSEYSFFDEATIAVKAGSGGQGSSTYKRGTGGQDGVPDGGSGGKGGSVVLVVDESLNTLAGLAGFFRAENGIDGGRTFKNGKNGRDLILRVPPGTIVQAQTAVHDTEGVLKTFLRAVGSVDRDQNTSLLVAAGGEGGEGSGVQGRKGRGVHRPRSPPMGGVRNILKLTLKIVADVALVGVPNAGKSTFLASVTRAKPKIASYPFTTVVPNLGVWVPPNEFSNSNDRRNRSAGAGSAGLVLCDVPGLIAGAAEGVGLGHAFLRHVERCHVILHLVDATSNDPIADFHMLNREIVRYGNGKLAQMPQIIVVNKIDAFDDGDNHRCMEWEKGLTTRMKREELEGKLKSAMTHTRLMWMSAKEKEGVDDLMLRMAMFVKKVKDAKTTTTTIA